MGVENIKGSYDAIFSLGDLCLTSIQLEKNNLRNFSGVLDWMASPFLNHVNRLLENRFIGFFDKDNLRIIGYASESIICVSDEGYQLVSNHDFETSKGNTLQELNSYDEVMEKYQRRINRTLDKFDHAERLLFIRTEGNFEDTMELHRVLSSVVKNDFQILIVNHTSTSEMKEKSWPIDKVTVVELPEHDKWNSNDHLWKSILDGVTLKG